MYTRASFNKDEFMGERLQGGMDLANSTTIFCSLKKGYLLSSLFFFNLNERTKDSKQDEKI